MHSLTLIFAVLAAVFVYSFKDAGLPRHCAQAEENGFEISEQCQAIADEWNARNGVGK